MWPCGGSALTKVRITGTSVAVRTEIGQEVLHQSHVEFTVGTNSWACLKWGFNKCYFSINSGGNWQETFLIQIVGVDQTGWAPVSPEAHCGRGWCCKVSTPNTNNSDPCSLTDPNIYLCVYFQLLPAVECSALKMCQLIGELLADTLFSKFFDLKLKTNCFFIFIILQCLCWQKLNFTFGVTSTSKVAIKSFNQRRHWSTFWGFGLKMLLIHIITMV